MGRVCGQDMLAGYVGRICWQGMWADIASEADDIFQWRCQGASP